MMTPRRQGVEVTPTELLSGVMLCTMNKAYGSTGSPPPGRTLNPVAGGADGTEGADPPGGVRPPTGCPHTALAHRQIRSMPRADWRRKDAESRRVGRGLLFQFWRVRMNTGIRRATLL